MFNISQIWQTKEVVSPPHFIQQPEVQVKHNIRKDINEPIDCILLRSIGLSIVNIAMKLESLPLLPTGSAWVCLHEPRDKNGCLSVATENLVISLVESGWFLADRVVWVVGKTPIGVLEGSKNKRYLGSCGMWLRFTKVFPKDVPCEMPNPINVWERTLQEEASWYEPFIKAVTPVGGLVVDAFYINKFVGVAAENLGRKFIGVDPEREK